MALHPASSRPTARLLPELRDLAIQDSLLWAGYQQHEARLRLPPKVALGLPHWLQKLCHNCICSSLLDSNGTPCGYSSVADGWHSSCCIQTS